MAALQLLRGKAINIPPSKHSHQPGRQGGAVPIPEPPEAQTLFLQHLPAWPTTLPGTVTPHSAGSLERNQEP